MYKQSHLVDTCALVLALCLGLSASAQDWQHAGPAELGIDRDTLATALAFLDEHCKEDGLEEVMVIRHGRLAWAGDSIHRVHDIWSCTKSFVSTAAGLLLEEGKIELDQPVADHEPLLREHYPTATYRHFLTMTSGYNAEGRSRWKEDSEDWSATPFVPAPPLFAPGEAYAYWDEAMIMLGRALTQVLDTVSLQQYLQQKLAGRVGIRSFDWWSEESLPNGTPINFGGTGLKMSAADQARFGLLYLNEGRWNGEQIVPADWVRAATRVQVPDELPVAETDRSGTDGSGKYGYNWWVIPAGPDHPAAAYTSGLNHNVCMIVPAWGMVVVRMGTDGNPEAGKQWVYTELLRRLAGGVR